MWSGKASEEVTLEESEEASQGKRRRRAFQAAERNVLSSRNLRKLPD